MAPHAAEHARPTRDRTVPPLAMGAQLGIAYRRRLGVPQVRRHRRVRPMKRSRVGPTVSVIVAQAPTGQVSAAIVAMPDCRFRRWAAARPSSDRAIPAIASMMKWLPVTTTAVVMSVGGTASRARVGRWVMVMAITTQARVTQPTWKLGSAANLLMRITTGGRCRSCDRQNRWCRRNRRGSAAGRPGRTRR